MTVPRSPVRHARRPAPAPPLLATAAGQPSRADSPHRADQLRCGTDHPLLSGDPGVPADRDRREPRLPGLQPLLLRRGQRQPARVLRLSRPGRGPVRRSARRAASPGHLGDPGIVAAPARQARRGRVSRTRWRAARRSTSATRTVRASNCSPTRSARCTAPPCSEAALGSGAVRAVRLVGAAEIARAGRRQGGAKRGRAGGRLGVAGSGGGHDPAAFHCRHRASRRARFGAGVPDREPGAHLAGGAGRSRGTDRRGGHRRAAPARRAPGVARGGRRAACHRDSAGRAGRRVGARRGTHGAVDRSGRGGRRGAWLLARGRPRQPGRARGVPVRHRAADRGGLRPARARTPLRRAPPPRRPRRGSPPALPGPGAPAPELHDRPRRSQPAHLLATDASPQDAQRRRTIPGRRAGPRSR